MINRNNRNISKIYFGSRIVNAVYKGHKLVWQRIISCFSKGYWIDEYSWTDDTSWTD